MVHCRQVALQCNEEKHCANLVPAEGFDNLLPRGVRQAAPEVLPEQICHGLL